MHQWPSQLESLRLALVAHGNEVLTTPHGALGLCRDYIGVLLGLYEPLPKLLVSPFVTLIIVPYIIPYIAPL